MRVPTRLFKKNIFFFFQWLYKAAKFFLFLFWQIWVLRHKSGSLILKAKVCQGLPELVPFQTELFFDNCQLGSHFGVDLGQARVWTWLEDQLWLRCNGAKIDLAAHLFDLGPKILEFFEPRHTMRQRFLKGERIKKAICAQDNAWIQNRQRSEDVNTNLRSTSKTPARLSSNPYNVSPLEGHAEAWPETKCRKLWALR